MNPSLTERVEDGDDNMNFGSIPNISLGDMEAAISVINEPDILESETESYKEAQKEDVADSNQGNGYEEYEDEKQAQYVEDEQQAQYVEDEQQAQYVEDEQQAQYVEDGQINEEENQEGLQEEATGDSLVQQNASNTDENGYEEWTEEDEANYQEQYMQEDGVANTDSENGGVECIQNNTVEQPSQSATSDDEYEEWTEEDEANYNEDEVKYNKDEANYNEDEVNKIKEDVVQVTTVMAEQKADTSTDEYEEWTEEDEANYSEEEREPENNLDDIELDEEFEDESEEEKSAIQTTVRKEVMQQKPVTNVGVVKSPSEKELALKKKIEQMELEEQQRKRELALEIQLQEKKRQAEEDKKKLDELARQRSQAQMMGKQPTIQQRPIQQRPQQSVRPPVQASSQPIVNKSTNKIEKYNSLDIVNLWEEVRKFMEANGVMTRAIPEKLLTDEFGAENVKKLYKKGYIIPFAGKRVTIG